MPRVNTQYYKTYFDGGGGFFLSIITSNRFLKYRINNRNSTLVGLCVRRNTEFRRVVTTDLVRNDNKKKNRRGRSGIRGFFSFSRKKRTVFFVFVRTNERMATNKTNENLIKCDDNNT